MMIYIIFFGVISGWMTDHEFFITIRRGRLGAPNLLNEIIEFAGHSVSFQELTFPRIIEYFRIF